MTDVMHKDNITPSLGEVALNPTDHRPVFQSSMEVYNYTGEAILFITGDGNKFMLEADSNDEYHGNIIIRQQMQWSKESCWLAHHDDYHTLPAELRAAIEQYYTEANELGNLYENGGWHTCRYDVVMRLPAERDRNRAISSKFPDVTFAREDGMRSLRLKHRQKHVTQDVENDGILVGSIIAKSDLAYGCTYVHMHGFFVACKRLHSDTLPEGTVVCLLTGNVIHQPGSVDQVSEFNTYMSAHEALSEVRLQLDKAYADREDSEYEHFNNSAKAIKDASEERDKREEREQAMDLKRFTQMTDVATSVTQVSNKIDAENTKTIVGLATSFFKK